MLKDITLGQYFPGNSFLHRLDPRTKVMGTLIYIVTLFLCQKMLTYGLVLVFLITALTVSKVGFRTVTKGLKPVLFLLIFTGVLNLFFTRDGTPLLELGRILITVEGCWRAFYMVLRIMMLIVGTFLLTYTTSPILLTDALEQLLGWMKKIRVPVHELAMIMSIALRFIPTLIEETDKLMSAQKARGADFESGNLIHRAKALVPLLIPLFISAFRRAEELAVAMESRCYHGGDGRTRLRELHYAPRDYFTLAGLLVFAVGIGVLGLYFKL